MHEEVRSIVSGQHALDRVAILDIGAGRATGAVVPLRVTRHRGDFVAFRATTRAASAEPTNPDAPVTATFTAS